MKKVFALAAIVVAVMLVCATSALADASDWTASANIKSPFGNGFNPTLNVTIANSAQYADGSVNQVEVSEDQVNWSDYSYNGSDLSYVLLGTEGAKTAYIRFLASDGTYSDTITVKTIVDTKPPTTVARNRVRVMRGHYAVFSFRVRDSVSTKARPGIVVRNTQGKVVSKTATFGWLTVNRVYKAWILIKLHPGSYTWSVRAIDQARHAQSAQNWRTLVVLK